MILGKLPPKQQKKKYDMGPLPKAIRLHPKIKHRLCMRYLFA